MIIVFKNMLEFSLGIWWLVWLDFWKGGVIQYMSHYYISQKMMKNFMRGRLHFDEKMLTSSTKP